MEKKLSTVAIPPEGCESYLTNGKEYEIIFWHKKRVGEIQDHFEIIDDFGTPISYCVPIGSVHLNGKNWILK